MAKPLNFKFGKRERRLSIKALSKRVMRPSMVALAVAIDRDILALGKAKKAR